MKWDYKAENIVYGLKLAVVQRHFFKKLWNNMLEMDGSLSHSNTMMLTLCKFLKKPKINFGIFLASLIEQAALFYTAHFKKIKYECEKKRK